MISLHHSICSPKHYRTLIDSENKRKRMIKLFNRYGGISHKHCLRLLHSAYVIKPNTTAQEQEKQACYLTNTILQDKSPPIHYAREDVSDNHSKLIDSVRRCIVEVNYFHRDEEVKITKRTTDRKKAWRILEFKWKIANHILQNLFCIIWSSKDVRNSGLCNTTMSYRPDIMAPWSRMDKKLQVSGKHGHLISGRNLLPQFADVETIESTRNQEVIWDDIISPYFDLHELPSTFQSNRGFHDHAPFPCPQKLLTINNFRWKTRMNTGQGIFYSFAHALTYALNNGAEMGKDLKEPIPIQYVAFNGTSFYFVWYQLNTLNFNKDKTSNNSIKNIAWISEQKLYDQVTDRLSEPNDFITYIGARTSFVDFDRKKLSETFKNEQSVNVAIEGFNPQAAKMFVDFMLYPLSSSK